MMSSKAGGDLSFCVDNQRVIGVKATKLHSDKRRLDAAARRMWCKVSEAPTIHRLSNAIVSMPLDIFHMGAAAYTTRRQ